MHNPSISVLTMVKSLRSTAEIGATLNPNWGSADTSPSEVSRDNASRPAPRLTERCLHRSLIRRRSPGLRRQANNSDRNRSYASWVRLNFWVIGEAERLVERQYLIWVESPINIFK